MKKRQLDKEQTKSYFRILQKMYHKKVFNAQEYMTELETTQTLPTVLRRMGHLGRGKVHGETVWIGAIPTMEFAERVHNALCDYQNNLASKRNAETQTTNLEHVPTVVVPQKTKKQQPITEQAAIDFLKSVNGEYSYEIFRKTTRVETEQV